MASGRDLFLALSEVVIFMSMSSEVRDNVFSVTITSCGQMTIFKTTLFYVFEHYHIETKLLKILTK